MSRPCVSFVHSWSVGNFSSPPSTLLDLGATRPTLGVPGEPRRAVPHAVVEAIIDMVEARYLHDFFAVQMVFLILVLYYSFSRTECPCPKSYTGRECYDKDVHWNVCDFDIRIVAGVRAMFCRFRGVGARGVCAWWGVGARQARGVGARRGE